MTDSLPELQRWNNEPVLMHPDFVRSVAIDFAQFRTGRLQPADPLASLVAAYGGSFSSDKPFAFMGGVAFIPISGMLVHRFSGSWGWATGYTAIQNQLEAALADKDVKAIVLDGNSGGGDAAGVFELSEEIYNARSVKPITAVVDAHAYSACYALVSAASRVVVTPSGGVGSIGVVTAHADVTRALDKVGITVTMIHAGKYKVDSSPYKVLSKDAKARIQARVDGLYDDFVATVVRNRGIEEAVVRGTEAGTFSAKEALEIGLVDAIGTPREALTALFAELSGMKSKEQTQMSTKTDATQEQPAATPASAATPNPAELEQARTDASKAERERIGAIMNCDEAKGRESLAQHFAFNTTIGVDDAKAALAAAPVATAAAPAKGKSAFEQAMENGNPDVGADADVESDADKNPVKTILSDFAAASGYKLN